MRAHSLLILALSIHACVSGGETGSDDNPINATGGAGSGGGSGGLPQDGAPCPFKEYTSPGCGVNEPAHSCGSGFAGGCAFQFCSCQGVTITGCGYASEPYAHSGPCEPDGGPDADAGDGDTCVWRYDAPGCGSNAPAPLCTDGQDDACTVPFCGCDGVTFMGGCSNSWVPFAAYGPCQGDGG